MTTRRIARIITGFILLLVAAVIGGSFYMLAFSLRPDARMREKNATAYEYMILFLCLPKRNHTFSV